MAVEENDLRTQLVSAYRESIADDPPEKVETLAPETAPDKPAAELKADANGRFHGEGGRFASTAEKPAAETSAAPALATPDPKAAQAKQTDAAPSPDQTAATAKPAAAPAPPNGWSAEAKARWHELAPEIQAAVNQREQDVAKFTSKTDDERAFGREMRGVVQPYLAQIQAEGGTPAGAVQSLLNTAYVLRNGTPQQKQQALIGVAQQFQIELPGAADAPQVPPEMQALQQEIAQLKGSLQQITQGSQQAAQASIQSDIEAFAADTSAHPHFVEVKAHMAALLRGGVAKDLQDAYEQACYARPDIRATLSAQQRATEEQKRRSEEKARADAARNKAVSITGGPGSTAAKSAPADRTLREELEANFRTASGAV